jgi:hypothetical protein
MDTSRRSGPSLDALLVAGALVTIATGGTLIGIGLREGDASRAFRLAGRGLLERFGVAATSAPLTSVAFGFLHHLVVATLWGMVASVVLRRGRGTAAAAASVIAVTVAYAALAVTVLPPFVRIGYAVTSDVASVVPMAAAMLVALSGALWVEGGRRATPA